MNTLELRRLMTRIATYFYILGVLLPNFSTAQTAPSLGKYYFDHAGIGHTKGVVLFYNEEEESLDYDIKDMTVIPFVPAFSMTLANGRDEPTFYYTGKYIINIENQQIATTNKTEFKHGIDMFLNWDIINFLGPHNFPKTSVLLPGSSPTEFLLIHSGIKVWQDDPVLFQEGTYIQGGKSERFLLPDFFDDYMKHDTYSDGIMATKFTINDNNNIEVKPSLNEFRIGYGRYRSELAACKHANGKDWWIIAPKITHNLMSVFLYDLEEITYVGEFPLSTGNTYSNPVLGSFVFSPDGSKLLRTHRRIRYFNEDPNYLGPDDILEVWEFDRCTGTVLSDPYVIAFPRPSYVDPSIYLFNGQHDMFQKYFIGPDFLTTRTFVNFVGCFSEDASKIYVANGIHLIQLDLENNFKQDTLFTYDNISKAVKRRISDEVGYLPTLLDAFWYLPNGKIAVGSNNVNSAVHIIHSPNLQGDQAQFEFEALQLKPKSGENEQQTLFTLHGLPSFPHYNMSPLYDIECEIEEPEEPEPPAISVGPNPFTNEISINIPFNGFYAIDMYDLLGRHLYSKTRASPGTEVGTLFFDTSNFPVGVYVLVIENMVTGNKNAFKLLKNL